MKQEETKIKFNGIKYAFIIHNSEFLVRRIDGVVPNTREVSSVTRYLCAEGFMVLDKSLQN